MPDVLYLVGWNQLVAVLMAAAVWSACRTRMLARRPAVCHGLWLLVLLKLVTPPLVSVPVLPALAAAEQSGAATSSSAARAAGRACDCCAPIGGDSETMSGENGMGCGVMAAAKTTGSPPSAGAPRPARRLTAQAIAISLLGASLSVTCGLWFAAARRFLQVRRLLRGGAVESGRAAELLRDVARRFNSRPAASLRIVDAPTTPMLWAEPGNPAIVLPRQLVDTLSDEGLRSILAHELGHFVRRDHWANWFAFFVTTLFWWNPIAWAARRQLSAAAEACCDAVALERLHDSRRAYAETLLAAVDFVAPAAPLRSAFGITFGESRSLRRRFEMIADADVNARVTRGGWLLLAVGAAAVMLAPAQAEQNSLRAATALQREAAAEAMPLPDGDRQAEPFAALCCPS